MARTRRTAAHVQVLLGKDPPKAEDIEGAVRNGTADFSATEADETALFLHRLAEAMEQYIEGLDAPGKIHGKALPAIVLQIRSIIADRQSPRFQDRVFDFIAGCFAGPFLSQEIVRSVDSFLRTQQARSKGATVTNSAHVQLHSQYQPAVARLMTDGLNYTSATEEVASSFGVSGSTVRRHTVNPDPRNRSKWRG